MAYNQRIDGIMLYVQTRCPAELSWSAITVFGSVSSTSQCAQSEVAIKVYVPSIKRWLITVSWKYGFQFIYNELGAKQECRVAEHIPDKWELKFCGTATPDAGPLFYIVGVGAPCSDSVFGNSSSSQKQVGFLNNI